MICAAKLLNLLIKCAINTIFIYDNRVNYIKSLFFLGYNTGYIKKKVENMKSSASSRVLILRKYRYIKIGIEEVNCWINKYF
ncbi:MAG TPA: hypothetical protein DCM29_10235 [Bacteroides sp.]|nr:hypothetical protein [Bacteroides sp.]